MKRALLFLWLTVLWVGRISAQNKTVTIKVNDRIHFDMVYIPADTFVQKNYYGDTICDYCHLCPIVAKNAYNGFDTVVLSPYYIAKFEMTREIYSAIMHKDPSYYLNDKSRYNYSSNATKDYPVETVSWYDVQEFIENLNAITGKHFRLPTETEWTHAARGGQPSLKYSGSNTVTDVAWDIWSGLTHPVGGKKPNGYGLYDMSGNISEWCSDWFSSDYYLPDTLYNNPAGPETGILKIIKGGSWGITIRFHEVNTRVGARPDQPSNGTGFRLAMDAD